MYLSVTNSDSKDFYADNKASHFRVKLGKTVHLEGNWSVAIAEIHVSDNTANFGLLSINCDVCNGIWINGLQSHLLRRFNCRKNVHESFPILFYLPVEKVFIDTLEFFITTGEGEEASLSADVKVEFTLHFRQNV
jgi:hypothetical protein